MGSNYSDSGKLCWNESNHLTWKNYKGKPDNAGNTRISAITHISISYEVFSSNRVLVQCCMSEKKSWVKKEDRTDPLLEHEQTHFNIGELFARKIRQEISTLTSFDISAIKNIHGKWLNEYFKMQEQYDEETNNSLIEEKQLEWQQKVNEELFKLVDYSDILVIKKQ